MDRVLTVLISHQNSTELKSVLDYWQQLVAPDPLLLVHGGTEEHFARVEHIPKIFVADPRLRTRDHQREHQSWGGIFHAVAEWLKADSSLGYVYLPEYDHIPLVTDLCERLRARANAEAADLLAHHLQRVDGTSNAHFLYHQRNSEWRDLLAKISCRRDRGVILSMLGTGSFWRRQAFEHVTRVEEPSETYFEIFLPTVAHHLGYRVRDFGAQNEFVTNLGERSDQIESARARGGWSLHPVKKLPCSGNTATR